MKARWPFAFIALLLQQGCMMGMMGGMGGGRTSADSGDVHGRAAGRDHVIIRLAEGDLELSADFPVFGPQDALEYRVTLRHRAEGLVAAADVTLSSSPDGAEEGHGSHSALWTPTMERDGAFVFRPSLARGASYRLVVVAKGIDGRSLDPPLTIAHVVRLEEATAHAGLSRRTDGSGLLRPLFVASAGLMMLMMVFVVR